MLLFFDFLPLTLTLSLRGERKVNLPMEEGLVYLISSLLS